MGKKIKESQKELTDFDGCMFRIDLERMPYNSAYARIKDVSRETYIKLVRGLTRDEIPKAQHNGLLKYELKEIATLKQVPENIPDVRGNYSLLFGKKNCYKQMGSVADG